MKSHTTTWIVIILFLILIGAYVLTKSNSTEQIADNAPETESINEDTPIPVEPDGGIGDGAEPLDELLETPREEVLGQSVNGHDIVAHHFGTGDSRLLFIGGTHGGYSGNTVTVANELIDYLDESSEVVPENITVTVIPVLNPDGLEAVYNRTDRVPVSEIETDSSVTTKGRFNGNTVDLNRNFDCQWQAEGMWRNQAVSGGSEPFSEPESQVVREYVSNNEVVGALVWYSAAGGVYSSNCNTGVSPQTKSLTNLYASAAGYDAFEEFDFYEITGDMVNWFAKNEIPAISVLLSDHENAEWEKNKKGIEAMLNYYAE